MSLRRREFIGGLGGAAAWPLAVRAQQGDRVRRIGLLVRGDENDPVRAPPVSAFIQARAADFGRIIRLCDPVDTTGRRVTEPERPCAVWAWSGSRDKDSHARPVLFCPSTGRSR